MNKVQLIGRLGNNPEGGENYKRFSVATSERYTNKQGEKVEKTEWHNVVAFGKTGEVIEKYFKKGDPIYLEGKIQTTKKEDKYYTSIIMTGFEFLPRVSEGVNNSSAKPEPFNPDTSEINDDLPF
ncbi:single-stranded DNA-binding protein [Flavobacteriaceae bacterium Ap0902]|nr:single-stranded DNA-binding protein [Flavobacteriaceae bacterium Ap0902]